jgi:shikimate dehydrogenase
MKYFRLGLIGYPLEHSLSPDIHRRFLSQTNKNGDYSLWPILPGDFNHTADQMTHAMLDGSINGINVTIPYKQKIIQFVDQLAPSAKAVGAVNTLYSQNGKIIGTNTDIDGFKNELISTGKSFKHAVVLGAGGAARAVVYGLSTMNLTVTICARNVLQAESLAHDIETHQKLNSKLGIVHWNDQIQIADIMEKCDLVVNTTPIGMFPDMDSSPLAERYFSSGNFFSFDLVYNPLVTKYLSYGLKHGHSIRSGLGMLVEQAALSYKLWVGEDIDKETKEWIREDSETKLRK